MTDDEIIKALEYKTKVGCELCDLKPDIYCQTCNIGLLKQSLDLINRQKADKSWKFRATENHSVQDYITDSIGKTVFLTRSQAEEVLKSEEKL